MPLCLSFLQRRDDAVLRNHAHYCRLHGYPHQWVESERILHPALRASAKYSEILRHLRTLAEGDWLFFIDGDSVVFHPVAIDALMQGRDLLAAESPPAGSLGGLAMTNMMVLRHTAANRAMLHQLIVDAGHVIARVARRIDEAARLRPAGMRGCNAMEQGVYVNVSWRIAQWHQAPVFVVHLGASPVEVDGEPGEDMLHDLNLQRVLVDQVNASLTQGSPVLQPPAYPEISAAAADSYNPEARIAFLTLYTPHIQAYARVSEHNVRRYCDRHGHAYHVYRDIPAAIGPGINGSWIRSWLINQHLAHHEWVIWVDADVVFRNPARRIEPLLEGRDLLLAKDIGAWQFNSGVMGFRNTPGNARLLDRIWERIGAVADKSAVYSSQGDQYYTNEVLGEEGLVGEPHILDNLSINTPPHLASDDTLLVHFINLSEPYRSVYMAAMDARSQRGR
ncbi:galactosyl transferase GMA12/MNN10 family protein [Variovorax sp. OK605]|uniref:galactosyl transferase GMA12/MNN10 family protein n=1 Tax=Variovorax sp. OK605 TaxID=1855317 RepID=UPI0008E7FD62|nr:galactosyl transferase GMA12/MNN10 family protein [Variovorax sp. OK605]SFO72267.1 galactosyl transferase GMA12/MNN10 family protein [Variovorax sp. OK605]